MPSDNDEAAPPQTGDPEIEAMAKVSDALRDLPEDAVARVLRWAVERYGASGVSASALAGHPIASGGRYVVPHQSARSSAHEPSSQEDDDAQFPDVADFYAAAEPSGDAEKALVVGYWLQFIRGKGDLDTQSVNNELKHMGYRIGNITRAFDALTRSRPQLAIQTRKAGSTKQARKKFKLTTEGKRRVEEMMRQGEEWLST